MRNWQRNPPRKLGEPDEPVGGQPIGMSLEDVRMTVHESISSAMRHLIVPKRPLNDSVFVDQYAVGVNLASFSLASDRPVLVEYILWAFNPVAAGTLTIGDRVLPISADANKNMTGLQVNQVLYPKDVITLNVASATSCFIEIMGRVIDGTEWSRL